MIQRWQFSCLLQRAGQVCTGGHTLHEDGKWVKWDDVAQLATQQAQHAVSLLERMSDAVASGVEHNWAQSFKDVVYEWRTKTAPSQTKDVLE